MFLATWKTMLDLDQFGLSFQQYVALAEAPCSVRLAQCIKPSVVGFCTGRRNAVVLLSRKKIQRKCVLKYIINIIYNIYYKYYIYNYILYIYYMIVYDYIWFPLKNLPYSPWSPYAPHQITQITPGRAHCSAVPQAHDVVLSPQSKHLLVNLLCHRIFQSVFHEYKTKIPSGKLT